MSFDSLMMKAITDELQRDLSGAAVQKVSEPDRGVLILHLYNHGEQANLLLSIDSRYARVHLTNQRYQSQGQPSPFCMLLRKYLIGGRAVAFRNPPLERILAIDFDPPDGLPAVTLIAETMSRRSNLILVNGEGLILGAARLVSWDKNPLRTILAGEKFQPVPAQQKLNPLTMSEADFASAFRKELEITNTLNKALLATVNGISPLAAKELLYRSQVLSADNLAGPERSWPVLYREIKALFTAADAGNQLAFYDQTSNQFAAYELTHPGNTEPIVYNRFSEMLDQFYRRQLTENREKAQRETLSTGLTKKLKALERKKSEQERELVDANNAPASRLFGELLLTYGHQINPGDEQIVLPDIYNPDQLVTVPLDPSLNARANAQKHFNRYRKAKKGQEEIKKQLRRTKAELSYGEELRYSIESNRGNELEEIRQEMIEAGYLRNQKKATKKADRKPQPLTFKSSAGRTILIGKNNRQNDHITFKAAVRRDTWLHVRQLPGSHVILKEAPYPPPAEDLEEAAFLAAYFSRGKNNNAVEVDYTEVRHVRRRPGGKPGLVFYENYETITVNPGDRELLNKFSL